MIVHPIVLRTAVSKSVPRVQIPTLSVTQAYPAQVLASVQLLPYRLSMVHASAQKASQVKAAVSLVLLVTPTLTVTQVWVEPTNVNVTAYWFDPTLCLTVIVRKEDMARTVNPSACLAMADLSVTKVSTVQANADAQ